MRGLLWTDDENPRLTGRAPPPTHGPPPLPTFGLENSVRCSSTAAALLIFNATAGHAAINNSILHA
jgi:hypothetical protein